MWTYMLILLVLYTTIMFVTIVSVNANNIPILNGSNFKDWKKNVLIILGCMDLDLVFQTGQPSLLKTKSTSNARRYFEKWECSNRLSLIMIKHDILEAFKGQYLIRLLMSVSSLLKLRNVLQKNNKAETSTLLASLISIKSTCKENFRSISWRYLILL